MTSINSFNQKLFFNSQEEKKESLDKPLTIESYPDKNISREESLLSETMHTVMPELASSSSKENLNITEKNSSNDLDINAINSLFKSIFNYVLQNGLTEIKKQFLHIKRLSTISDKDFASQLDRINRAYLFFQASFKATDLCYKLMQLDRGKHFELCPNLKTTMISTIANAAKLIPIVGDATSSGLKKILEINCAKRRIKRAGNKSMHLLIDEEIFSFIAILLTSLHLEEIRETTVKDLESYFFDKFTDFLYIAKKQMEEDPYPENLNYFWADVLSAYLQATVEDEFSLKNFRNKQLKLLLKHCQKKEQGLVSSSEEIFSAEDLQRLFDPSEKKNPLFSTSAKKISEEERLSSTHNSPYVDVGSSFAIPKESPPSPIIINLTLNVTSFANQHVEPININLSNITQNLSISLFPSPASVTLDANKISYMHQSVCMENPSRKMDALNFNPINRNPVYGQQTPYSSITHSAQQRERFYEKNLVSTPSSLYPASSQQTISHTSAITQFEPSPLNDKENSKQPSPEAMTAKLMRLGSKLFFFLFTCTQEKSHLHDNTSTKMNLAQTNRNKYEESPEQKNYFPFFARSQFNKNTHSTLEADRSNPAIAA